MYLDVLGRGVLTVVVVYRLVSISGLKLLHDIMNVLMCACAPRFLKSSEICGAFFTPAGYFPKWTVLC